MSETGELAIAIEEAPGGTSVVQVDGELDMATAGALETALQQVGAAKDTVLDLTACTFLDSSAVRVLVASARATEEAGGSLALVASSPAIVRVLEISAVDTMVPLHATLDDAL